MATLVTNTPIPVQDPIAQPRRRDKYKENEKDPQEGMLTFPWLEYFTGQSLVASQSPARLAVIDLSAQTATIGATDMSNGALGGGIYRVSYYARITVAATVSSSLTISLDWTDGGVAPIYSGAAITGNTVTTFQSGTQLINVDNLSPVRYQTTYVSVGATPMQYKILITLEQILA